jgi:hypothetical protein
MHFKEEEIETITFDSLVEGVNHIDLLHIDTEGYDYEIIKSIDFDKHQPSLILFEHAHLKKVSEVHAYLSDMGYVCEQYELDTLAIHKDWNNEHI